MVENRQGADGIPAVTAFLSARDNHTFLFSFAGIVTFNHLLHERLPYDPKELVPIAPVIDNFLGVSATATLKVNTLAELVAAAKAQPGKLNWAATPGLPFYVLLALAAICRHRDGAGALSRFRAGLSGPQPGRLHVAGTGVPTLVPHHRAGTAKLLFVTNRERSPQAPDVPTAARGRISRPHVRGRLRHLWLARHAGRDQAARRRRHRRDRRRSRSSAPASSSVGTAPRTGTPEEFAAAIEEQRAKIAAIHARDGQAEALTRCCFEWTRCLALGQRQSRKCHAPDVMPDAAAAAGVARKPRSCCDSRRPQAQSWPQRPVRFIIPFGPGAGADIGARLIQEKLSTRWGKPVVIENRPGGDSIIAIQAVLSANDDHTFLWGPSGNFTVHPYLIQEAALQPGRHHSDRALLRHHPRRRRAGSDEHRRSSRTS